MSETTSYQRNRDIVLNRAKVYYKSNKEKNKKRECGRNRYHNMSEEKKRKKLKEYRKNYREAKKVSV